MISGCHKHASHSFEGNTQRELPGLERSTKPSVMEVSIVYSPVHHLFVHIFNQIIIRWPSSTYAPCSTSCNSYRIFVLLWLWFGSTRSPGQDRPGIDQRAFWSSNNRKKGGRRREGEERERERGEREREREEEHLHE